MEKLIVGIDGGGTKTELLLAGADGTVFNRVICGSGNINDIGADNLFTTLRAGLDALLHTAEGTAASPDAIFAGLAGGGLPQNRTQTECFLRTLFPHAAVVQESDTYNIPAAGLGDDDGVALIAGTGSAALIRRAGQMRIFGGWGYLFEDAGSGYNIGRDAISAALCEEDGLGAHTLLTPLLHDRMGSSVREALCSIYAGGKRTVASLAPLVFDAFRKGDAIAVQIIEKTVAYLVDLAKSAAAHLPPGVVKVVLAGGLFDSPEFFEMMRRNADTRLHLEKLSRPPVYGALLQAATLLKIPPDGDFTINFDKSYASLCKIDF